MDEIKTILIFAVIPWLLCVLYFENDIWGDPGWLGGRQVSAYHFGGWVCIGEVTENRLEQRKSKLLQHEEHKTESRGFRTRSWANYEKSHGAILHGPYPRTGSNINNFLWVGRDRCEKQLAIE